MSFPLWLLKHKKSILWVLALQYIVLDLFSVTIIYFVNTYNAEGRPDRTGLRLSNELAKLDVPVKLLIDSAVAYTMDEVDMVFVGADGVVESGGIINMMGTYQIALVAHSMNKPVYVAAESYKVCQNLFSLHCPVDKSYVVVGIFFDISDQ